MARPTKEFFDAWRGLSAFPASDGWQAISVGDAGLCSMRAGRRFPGNEEALLVRFDGVMVPPLTSLPRGQGFSVERIGHQASEWLALSRQENGAIELFGMMVADVSGAMDLNASMSGEQMLRIFLGRVRGWQEFMKVGSGGLSPEAEIGLVGELAFLESMLAAGMDSTSSVQAWIGPLDAPQDFAIGSGAVEVKATLAPVGFRAKISSLEQLDDAVRSPLFFAAARFVDTLSGKTLPQWVDEVKSLIKHDPSASNLLADRLLMAGYAETHADRYIRRFALTELKLLEVNESFPRLTAGRAPDGVLRANYEIDVNRADGERIAPSDALTRLGALQKWN